MSFAANVIHFMQMGAIGLLFAGGDAVPAGLAENKATAFMGILFGGNMVSSSMTKTSAFEIYVGRKRVWSTLAAERMPNLDDLVEGFERVGITITVPQEQEQMPR